MANARRVLSRSQILDYVAYAKPSNLKIGDHGSRRSGPWSKITSGEFCITLYVWEYQFNGEANAVESYISYLQRKVDNAEPCLIHTVHGIGYVLRIPPSERRATATCPFQPS
jgi:hypothetical protein